MWIKRKQQQETATTKKETNLSRRESFSTASSNRDAVLMAYIFENLDLEDIV